MKAIPLSQIVGILGQSVISVIGTVDRTITHPAAIADAQSEQAITFCSKKGIKARQLLQSTSAKVVLCENDESLVELADHGKTFIIVEDPRASFAFLVKSMFADPSPRGIHTTAVVHPDAKIDPDVFIGPHSVVGKATIGQGSVIYSGVHIYDRVTIGRNVTIHSGCVIGSDGFGFSRNTNEDIEKFPHVGSVIIEDDVELQADCHVSRGTLGSTRIMCGSKFDSGCHIAHNVVVGRHCLVAAHAMIAGSVTIGDQVWVGPATAISDGITVGNKASITIGSVVVRDVPEGQRVTGNFAIDHRKFMSFLKTIGK